MTWNRSSLIVHSRGIEPVPTNGAPVGSKPQIREVFETFDQDGSGEIDVDELYIAMRAMNEPFQSKEDGTVETFPTLARR
jgi:hypothetical protein